MTPKPNLQLEKSVVLDGGGLAQIFGELSRQGFRLVGPTLREGRLVLGDLAAPDDLPVGLSDLQEPGSFRRAQGRAGSFFGCRVGQESWKKFLFPSNIRLFAARRQGPGWEALPAVAPVPRFAFIGVRACELAALEVHDRIFLKGPFQDPIYRPRREGAFIVAVNCTQGGGTCFCASMGTGPRAVSGFDLALTEVLEKGAHYFVAESGSERGAALLSRVEHRPAGAAEHQAIQRLLAGCLMGRDLDTRGLKEFLYRSYEHPHWDEVGDRCLTCGNCVMVCPTCFSPQHLGHHRHFRGDRGALAPLGHLLLRGILVPARGERPGEPPGPLPPMAHPQAGRARYLPRAVSRSPLWTSILARTTCQRKFLKASAAVFS